MIHMKDNYTPARFVMSGLILFCAAVALLITAGCSGTSGTTDNIESAEIQESIPDTGSGTALEPEFPPGKFTVQLGAYQSEDAARTVSSLAGSRFTRQLYTVYDSNDRLYKVMLGMFDTKDQARVFRDGIVRQYTDDYRDAWVSELTR